MNHLQNPIFKNETKAREWLEARVWPNGPVCPHCGSDDHTAMKGKAHRPGLYQCNACRKQFTVTVGTVMERSKIPLTKWLLAIFLISASKKGMSAHQMHRMLDLPYKTAWFLLHRIREAMREGKLAPMGGPGSPVEADETFYVRDSHKSNHGKGKSMKVLSLVDREAGQVRSFHVKDVKAETLQPIIRKNIRRESVLMTDMAHHYRLLGKEFQRHGAVDHSRKQWREGDAHTNTIEGYFSLFKRGMRGIYQHCGEQHLHRYLAEFDFRYNNRKISDHERAEELTKGIVGKRLTYRRPDETSHA